ncbi:MAG TPA: RnfABCDGE type electron transport complex subunit C [Candidatus Faecisoma merdavium]|nr:RnfABCDGE type electron transport complex subunit C [Candidatus Faecisoma merdavium]
MKVKIPKHKLTNEKLCVYNKPKKVYIPLISGNDENITILVNKGEYVYKGSIIGKRKGDFRIPIHSSVSGIVVDFEERTCFNGKKIKCIVIENDFKEKIEMRVSVKRNINKYSKEDFIDRLKECGIIGLGGAGFPTYVKYEANNIDTLIINAVECEPYITADYAIAKQKCEEILESIDAILEINKIKQAYIAIQKDNVELRKVFDSFIGTYLKINIKLVDNFYSVGWERTLVKKITGKDYDKVPSEVGVIVNNISTIYAIYEALKYNKPLIERFITFSGENIDDKRNVLVKIGTDAKEILKEFNLKEDSLIIAGGPMMGTKVDDLVISANLNCVLALNKNVEQPSICLKCGKCVEACPAKLSPVLIMNGKEKNLRKLHPEKCIGCGLCSYVCPAKLLVREKVKEAKNKVRGDK